MAHEGVGRQGGICVDGLRGVNCPGGRLTLVGGFTIHPEQDGQARSNFFQEIWKWMGRPVTGPSRTEISLFGWGLFRYFWSDPPSDEEKLLIGWTPNRQLCSNPPSTRKDSLFGWKRYPSDTKESL